jgi:predicted Zn finger-like uncharacterized protein
MLTRCPHCQTTFRVTPDQLKVRQGRVRCGRCQTVFDGIEALEDEGSRPAALEFHSSIFQAQAPAELLILGGMPPATKDVPPAPHPAREEAVDLVEGAESALSEETELEPLLHEDAPRRRAWPWILGILLALLVLGFQAIMQLRVELAVLYPSARPALLAVCEVLGCEVSLPRNIDLIGIETSDLHPDPAANGRLQLVASLRNRAPFAQPWPQLEVTLTDVADQPLVRRVFAPTEYLPADGVPAFAAKSEQPVNLLLEAPGVVAIGYRLYVFYP